MDEEPAVNKDPLLQILPELEDLPAAHQTLLAASKRRMLPSGALVFSEGHVADSLMGVLAGEVDVLRRFGNADRLIARLGPGALMGEAALVPGLARTASVRARDDVELLELPAGRVREVLLAHPSLALALLGTVMRRLQRRDEAYLGALHQGLEDRRRELAVLRARHAPDEDNDEVWCPSLEPTLDRARRLARSDLPVLITGESGTGKELLARFVHRHSGRAAEAMHSLNCAAIPGEIAEAELFGVRRGAFTGATQDRPGLFKTAHLGTLFLDEIGDLPLGQQAKLLRALQDGSFYPVGSQQPERSDVRLLSASNKDL
ncbi:MAG: sigma 54-interacting transcriptional regulator, partial [Polyangia bacterium]|nr:sigma 54-interacting transcriptional regulator [Polyangia bacterium]